jgi:hypothetical protein
MWTSRGDGGGDGGRVASGGPHMGGRVDTVVVSGCVDGGEARRALHPDGEFDGDIRVCAAFSSCR